MKKRVEWSAFRNKNKTGPHFVIRVDLLFFFSLSWSLHLQVIFHFFILTIGYAQLWCDSASALFGKAVSSRQHPVLAYNGSRTVLFNSPLRLLGRSELLCDTTHFKFTLCFQWQSSYWFQSHVPGCGKGFFWIVLMFLGDVLLSDPTHCYSAVTCCMKNDHRHSYTILQYITFRKWEI